MNAHNLYRLLLIGRTQLNDALSESCTVRSENGGPLWTATSQTSRIWLAHSAATLLSGFFSVGIVAQPCFST